MAENPFLHLLIQSGYYDGACDYFNAKYSMWQIDPSGKRAFIACPRDHFVAVVDLVKLERIATIDAGREPDGITWWDGSR